MNIGQFFCHAFHLTKACSPVSARENQNNHLVTVIQNYAFETVLTLGQAPCFTTSANPFTYMEKGDLIIRSSWKNPSKTTFANVVLWHIFCLPLKDPQLPNTAALWAALGPGQ